MGTAISASTLTTIAVFLPVVFIAGLAREIFKDLALTVTFSLLASLGVALTIVPSVAARLLSTKDTGRTKKTWLQRFFNKLQAGYNQVILWALGIVGLSLPHCYLHWVIGPGSQHRNGVHARDG